MDKITIPNGTIRLIPIKLVKSTNQNTINNNDLDTQIPKRPCLVLIKPLAQSENLQVNQNTNSNNDLETQAAKRPCLQLIEQLTQNEDLQANQNISNNGLETQIIKRPCVQLIKHLGQNEDLQANQNISNNGLETQIIKRPCVKLIKHLGQNEDLQVNQNISNNGLETQIIKRPCVKLIKHLGQNEDLQVNQNISNNGLETQIIKRPCVKLIKHLGQNEDLQVNQNISNNGLETQIIKRPCVKLIKHLGQNEDLQVNQNISNNGLETQIIKRPCVKLIKHLAQNEDLQVNQNTNSNNNLETQTAKRPCLQLIEQLTQNEDLQVNQNTNSNSDLETQTAKRPCLQLIEQLTQNEDLQANQNISNNDLDTQIAKRPCLELIKRLAQNEDLQVEDVESVLRQGQLDQTEIKAEPDVLEVFEVLEDSIEIVEHPLPDVISIRDSDDNSNRQSNKPVIRQKTLDSGLPSSISSYSTVCRDWLDSDSATSDEPSAPDPVQPAFWTPPEIKVGETYLVPTDQNRERWAKAKLVKFTSKSRLKLVSPSGKRVIKVSWKYLALERPPNSRIKVGGRVIAGFPQFDDSGKLVKFRGYRMGVVGENPVPWNGFRYLIIFDNGCWSYIQPDRVKPVFRSSKRVWKQVPQKYRKEVKQFLRGKFQPDRDISKGQWVSITSESSQLEGEQFSSVICDDCSLILVWYKHTRRPEWIHKGSPRIKLPSDF